MFGTELFQRKKISRSVPCGGEFSVHTFGLLVPSLNIYIKPIFKLFNRLICIEIENFEIDLFKNIQHCFEQSSSIPEPLILNVFHWAPPSTPKSIDEMYFIIRREHSEQTQWLGNTSNLGKFARKIKTLEMNVRGLFKQRDVTFGRINARMAEWKLTNRGFIQGFFF